jgi:hypothetical protein
MQEDVRRLMHQCLEAHQQPRQTKNSAVPVRFQDRSYVLGRMMVYKVMASTLVITISPSTPLNGYADASRSTSIAYRSGRAPPHKYNGTDTSHNP